MFTVEQAELRQNINHISCGLLKRRLTFNVDYDLEIKKAILHKHAQKIKGIDYCSGWNDYVNMGIPWLACMTILPTKC